MNDGTAPLSRMCSSATASSSAVLMPGRTLSRISASVRPPPAPHAACRHLLWRLDLDPPALNTGPAQPDGSRPRWRGGHVLDLAGGDDLPQQPGLVVVLDQRRGLLAEDLQPAPHGLRRVVVAAEQLAAAGVADTLVGRLVELDVPVACRNRGRCAARTAAGRSRPRRPTAPAPRRASRRARPGSPSAPRPGGPCAESRRAGSPPRRRPRRAGAHHRDGHLVGHQVAGVHVLLGLHTQLGLLG